MGKWLGSIYTEIVCDSLSQHTHTPGEKEVHVPQHWKTCRGLETQYCGKLQLFFLYAIFLLYDYR